VTYIAAPALASEALLASLQKAVMKVALFRFVTVSLVGGAVVAFSSVPALCWGREGHAIVARIAALELTSPAKAQVTALLGGDSAENSMAAVASWPDEIRKANPQTAPWHFVDIENGTAGYDAAIDCPNDNCVVAQITKDEHLLGDKSKSVEARAEALKFLIHFVGDVHQPLHDADNHDKGGNAVRIGYNGHQFNLHSLWDDEMVEQFGRDPTTVAHQFDGELSPNEKKTMMAGTPTDWANEGFNIAERDVYKHFPATSSEPIEVPESYVTDEGPAIKAQLEKGGLRLAWLLNRALGQ
jgi:S1/P1 Nuclease